VEGVIYPQKGVRSILRPKQPNQDPQLPLAPLPDVPLSFAISTLSLASSSSTPLVARTSSSAFSV